VAESGRAAGGSPVRRGARAFGRFWWDFLIGDTPELFVGAVVGVGLIALVCLDHSLRTVAAVLLPLWVAGLLAVSLWRARSKAGSN
jgi:hypothetical protein